MCKLITLCFAFVTSTSLVAQEKLPEFILQDGHSASVEAVAFSPDGKILASGSRDNTIKLWEVGTGRLLRNLEGHSDDIMVVTFSPDGKTLASGSYDNTVKLWDVASGCYLKTLKGHMSDVNALSFSTNGKTLVSGSWDSTVKIWDLISGRIVKTLKGHSKVVFSSDSKIMAYYDEKTKTVNLVEASTGKLFKNIKVDGCSAMTFSSDSRVLAIGGSGDEVSLLDVASGKLIRSIKDSIDVSSEVLRLALAMDNILSIGLSLDGKIITTGHESGDVKVWDVTATTPPRKLLTHYRTVYHSVRSVVFSPDGKILASGNQDNTIRFWDVGNGKLLKILDKRLSWEVGSASISPNGKILASVSSDTSVKVWNIRTGELENILRGHTDLITAVAFSANGKFLVSGSKDMTLKVWGSDCFKPWGTLYCELLETLYGHSEPITSVAFSSDDSTISSGSIDNTVKLWDGDMQGWELWQNRLLPFDKPSLLVSSRLLKTLEDSSSVSVVAFSPDGKILVSASDNYKLKLWDVASRRLFKVLGSHSSRVNSVAFSSDGKILASGSADSTVKLWDMATGRLLQTLQGHYNEITVVAFSPDDKFLVSGGKDKTIKVWDTTSGQFIKSLSGHTSPVTAIAFSLGGKMLISGSLDASIRFWQVETGEILATSYSFSTGDYFTYCQQGYFVASKEGQKFASWRIDNKVYTFEQYADKFSRPDLVAEILAGKKVPDPEIRLATDLPPELSWKNKFTNTQGKSVEIVLQFQGTSPLDGIEFVHNDNPVDVQKLVKGKETLQAEIRVPLELTVNENKFSARVWDKNRLKSNWVEGEFEYLLGIKGARKTITETITEVPKLGNYGKKYAIIIGISDYKNLPQTAKNKGDLVDLKYAYQDAIAFKQFLEIPELSGGQWEIRAFINEQATSKNVDDALTNLLTQANARDLIFIFFSGHGRSHPLREKDVYLLTWDFQPDDYRSGYSYPLLRDLIADARAEHVIAFIDACRSGTIGFKGDKTQASFSQDVFGERIAQIPENKVIFTSGRGTQPSWEDDTFKNGVFTHFLIKGLQGEAAEHKNPQFIDLGELAAYLQEQVLKYTQQRKEMSPQFPMLWEKNGAPSEDFPVAIRKQR